MSSWILSMFSDFLRDSGTLSKEDKKQVYDVVSNAVRFTRTHIARYRDDQGDIPSQVLSTKWQKAASQLRRIDAIQENQRLRDFAEMLEQKSKYWSDPKGYDVNLFNEYSMRLTEVESGLKAIVA